MAPASELARLQEQAAHTLALARGARIGTRLHAKLWMLYVRASLRFYRAAIARREECLSRVQGDGQ